MPLLIFFPTFILFFGTGVKSKMALGCLAAFFPIALNTIAGFNSVDLNLRTAAMSFGASRVQMLRRVLLPGVRDEARTLAVALRLPQLGGVATGLDAGGCVRVGPRSHGFGALPPPRRS